MALPSKNISQNMRDGMGESARVLVPGGIMALNVATSSISGVILAQRSASVAIHGPSLSVLPSKIWRHPYRCHYLGKTACLGKRPLSKLQVETTIHTSYRIIDNWEPIYIFRKKGEREIPSEDIVLKSKLTREQWIAYVPSVWAIRSCQEHSGASLHVSR